MFFRYAERGNITANEWPGNPRIMLYPLQTNMHSRHTAGHILCPFFGSMFEPCDSCWSHGEFQLVGHYYPCGVQGGVSADYLLSAGFQRAVMISDLSESFGQPIQALAPLKQSHEQILQRLCNYFVTLRPHQVTSTTRVTRRCSLTGRGKSS